MAPTHTTLDAAAVDRKARLAKLASLKRKQPSQVISSDDAAEEKIFSDDHLSRKTDIYISGRNYDVQTRNAKLGFENTPSSNVATLEEQADHVASEVKERAARDEEAAEKGIDLFKLQPKKPNWDLKRELQDKMKILDLRTKNAIARLVRERIENAKKEASSKTKQAATGGDAYGEELGIDGNTLVESVHQRENEKNEEERREREFTEEDTMNM